MTEETNKQNRKGNPVDTDLTGNVKYTTRHPVGPYSAESSFQRLWCRIQQAAPPDHSKRRYLHWRKYVAIAASVALLLISGYFILQYKSDNQYYTLTAGNARQQFSLPDGSRVWLNTGSRLAYTNEFGRKQRKVELTGEGYFDVIKDQSRPFIVTSGKTNVRVLGTRFNVQAYLNDKSIVTTLEEGSVSFNPDSPVDAGKHILTPGEQLRFDKLTQVIAVRKVDCSQYIAWKEGMFIFRRTPLEEAFSMMEHSFCLKIITKNHELKNLSITGRFNLDDKPEYILSIMKETLPFTYEIKDDTIIIK